MVSYAVARQILSHTYGGDNAYLLNSSTCRAGGEYDTGILAKANFPNIGELTAR